jgi:LSD1 subclass zinc finger protein
MGCELVVGPLSADGVAAVREYRKRSWGNHVVFYTESATQSQDARLPLQYGCMTILRRAGMSEPLESLISELRHHNRQPPAQPQEHVRGQVPRAGASAATTSGLHAPPAAVATPSAHAAEPSRIHDSRAVPPTGSVPQRIRRSVLPPAQPAGRSDSALSIDVPSSSRQASRVVVCTSCRQEFVVTASGNLPVRCSHCQTLNHLQ